MTVIKRMTPEKMGELCNLLGDELEPYGMGFMIVTFDGNCKCMAVSGCADREETIRALRSALDRMENEVTRITEH